MEHEVAGETDTSDWAAVAAAFDRIEPLAPEGRQRALRTLPAAIARQVAAMLAAAAGSGVLDTPVSDPSAAPAPRASLPEGERVGPFVVERLIGRGGMGEVYLARRADVGFDQRVALKLLRVDAVQNEALFARERRVLAKLENPGIARLVDGGLSAAGRPWMAMDYVDGLPIDRWCVEQDATLDERLRLVSEICEAVAYAHANLVVHRDLKPSNILVDAGGRVRLLDFGIAKLVEEGADTIPGDAVMTPQYAAPEQLEGEPPTVATDVHAIGLIMYELLAGAPPWSSEGGAMSALVRRVLREEPEPPSRAALRLGGKSDAFRNGDLDAIVLKALRKVPAERYASPRDLAADLRRFQDGRAVSARAGSRRYRARRYLRRHRGAIAAVATVLLALLVGTGGILLQARRTAVERDNALAEAHRSDAIVQTLTLIFAQGGYSSDLTLKQTLDESALRMLATLDGSARSGAAVNALSDLYVNMGDAKGSYDLLSKALAQGIGSDDAVTQATMRTNLADAAVGIGAPDDSSALLAVAERVFASAPERNGGHLQQIVLTRAAIARRKRDYVTAIGLLLGSLSNAERVYAANDSALLTHYNNLLVYLIEANRLDEVAPVFARLDRILARPGQRSTVQALGIDQLRGAWRLRQGDAAGAERIAADVVDRRRRLFGQTPGLAADLAQLGKVQLARGEFADARVSLLEARPLAMRFMGGSAVPTMVLELSLAQVHAELGDRAAAHATLDTVRPLVAAMPLPNPVAPQFAMTEALVAVAEGDRAGAIAASARAELAFSAMGPAGTFGSAAVRKIATRAAALP